MSDRPFVEKAKAPTTRHHQLIGLLHVKAVHWSLEHSVSLYSFQIRKSPPSSSAIAAGTELTAIGESKGHFDLLPRQIDVFRLHFPVVGLRLHRNRFVFLQLRRSFYLSLVQHYLEAVADPNRFQFFQM